MKKRSAKRKLFWTLYIPMMLILIITGLLKALLFWIEDRLRDFEGWCLDHAEHASNILRCGFGTWEKPQPNKLHKEKHHEDR